MSSKSCTVPGTSIAFKSSISSMLERLILPIQLPHCNENPIYVFPEKELRGLSPNFHIHVSVSDLNSPTIGPHIFLHQNRQTDCGNRSDIWMWKLGCRANSFLGILYLFCISVLCVRIASCPFILIKFIFRTPPLMPPIFAISPITLSF